MKLVRRWASPVGALVVLVVVFWRLGTGPFLDGLEAVDARALVAAAVIVFGTTFCSAWRWTIVARGLGVRLALPAAVAAYYRAVFLNLTLPGGVAGDVHRGVVHGREVQDLAGALKAVVWERAAGQVVQAVLTVAVLLVLPSPVRSSMPFVALALVATVVVVMLVGRLRIGGALSRWSRLRNTVVADIRNGVLRPSALPAVLLTSVLVVVGHTLTFFIAAHSAGVRAPISRLLPLALLALLAMVLPSIAGWGPREGATAWVFAAAGLGAGRGAASAVTYGVLVLAASLPGAIILCVGWLPRRRSSRTRQGKSEPTAPAAT
ncbi:MAG TPA: lysylphosphatidylglycerol synthase domain-containing protein [Mycobacteriales bacterium]|nr:lysylphosphatidylglycerol synthase domain-containing protein [Mycobacteriales bacterium]